MLKWFMTGHGMQNGFMPLSKGHDLMYGTLIEETNDIAEEASKKLNQ